MEDGYFEMKLKPSGRIVRVYNISDGKALIWNDELYHKQNCGWETVKVSKLVPVDYELESANHVSKTKANKAKKRMKLVDATWMTSDGRMWAHSDIDNAIRHEVDLMGEENQYDEA